GTRPPGHTVSVHTRSPGPPAPGATQPAPTFRCSLYQDARASGSRARKNRPPIPSTDMVCSWMPLRSSNFTPMVATALRRLHDSMLQDAVADQLVALAHTSS